MKKLTLIAMLYCTSTVFAQTQFTQTNERFKNGQFVYALLNNNIHVGEFWPISGLDLVTRQTDPNAFTGSIEEIQKKLGGVATAPDGMTGGSFGAYQLQGRCLKNGIPCGDGFEYDYGLILVSPNGYKISFRHKRDFDNFDSLYNALQDSKSSLFFLPSIYRNGSYLRSQKTIDKVFVRRETYAGEQIGVILFDTMVTYDEARMLILGLDRPNGASKTTHIYVLDGGSSWGQSCKEVNNSIQVIGTRDASVITNYLVFY